MDRYFADLKNIVKAYRHGQLAEEAFRDQLVQLWHRENNSEKNRSHETPTAGRS